MANADVLHASIRTTPSRAAGAPIDEALTLLLANEPEAALRWVAAALERDPADPLALIVTSRALARIGRRRAAIDGLVFAVERAILGRAALLALVAIDDLRSLGIGVAPHLDRVAAAFCQSASHPWFPRTDARDGEEPGPLSAILRGAALASKATQIVYEAVGVEWPAQASVPLFGALSEAGLRALMDAFDVVTVPARHRLVDEGQPGDAAYFVAHGDVELSRGAPAGDSPLAIARLASGGLFGELALLSQLPAPYDVVTTGPSILLVGRPESLERVAALHPDVGAELAAHCRRCAVSNLGRSSPVISAVPAPERAALVEHLEMRIFEQGARIVREGEDAAGLHLVVVGEAAVVARDGAERVVLETLTPGATVGEVELVLCREASADVIAVRDTATMFLPRDEFFSLAQDHPAIVHGLYAIAVSRHRATKSALEAGAAAVGDECVFPDAIPIPLRTVATERVRERARVYESAPPPALPAPPARVSSPVADVPVFRARAVLDAVATSPSRESSSLPPSIGPMTASASPTRAAPQPASGRFARLSLQGAAAVAVAASVAALLATHEREPRETTASAGAPAVPPPGAPPAPAPVATTSAAPSAPPAPPAPAGPPAPSTARIGPPTASETKAFLTRDLTKPRARNQARPASPPHTPSSPAPASPPQQEPRAANTGEDDFGGRE